MITEYELYADERKEKHCTAKYLTIAGIICTDRGRQRHAWRAHLTLKKAILSSWPTSCWVVPPAPYLSIRHNQPRELSFSITLRDVGLRCWSQRKDCRNCQSNRGSQQNSSPMEGRFQTEGAMRQIRRTWHASTPQIFRAKFERTGRLRGRSSSRDRS